LNKPDIKLRDPSVVMKLSRLGSFHQSKLSFLEVLLENLKSGIINEIYLILIRAVMVQRSIRLKRKVEAIR